MSKRILFIILVILVWAPALCIGIFLFIPYWIFTGEIIFETKIADYITEITFRLIE